jgi:hypothetical protein
MALEDLKENLREQFVILAGRIQESTAWMQLTEKYQNLSPSGQKGVLAGAAAFVVLTFLAVPSIFYFSSQDQVTDFEDKRQLIRDLFRVNREASALPPPPAHLTSSDLESKVRTTLNNARLQPEQIVSVATLPKQKVAGVPSNLEQAAVSLNLGKLNLTQIVSIASDLNTLHPTLRVSGLEIKASRDNDHYFDVIFKLVAFSSKAAMADASNGGFKSRKGSTSADEDLSEE